MEHGAGWGELSSPRPVSPGVSANSGIRRAVLAWNSSNAGDAAISFGHSSACAVPVSFFCQRGERFGAEFDLDRRVCFEVVVPGGVRWRSTVGGGDDETAVGLRAVCERGDSLGSGSGADVVDEDDRGAGQVAADMPVVCPELGDDVVGELTGHGRASGP